MALTTRTRRFESVLIAVIVSTVGLGCLCLGTGVAPTAAPSQSVPSATRPLQSTVQQLQSPTQTLMNIQGQLDSEGPWLLVETDQGLWAANPDGSGLTQLTNVDYWHGDLQYAVQPGGSQVVFISPGTYDFHNMALNLLRLPDGKVTKLANLTSAQTEAYADSSPGDPGFEALRAVGEQRSYAWSPDGTRLAFSGVMDGPSAEVYLYDGTAQNIVRVSHDDAQDFWPSWSPDGQHLLFLGAQGFGTGAGMVMAGVWVAAGDGNNATLLYPTDSSGEEIVGWLDNNTAILDTWGVVCGPANLRTYNVVNMQQTILSQDCITGASADLRGGTAMFSNDSGLYMLTADNPAPALVSQEADAQIDPWGADDYVFTVRFPNGGIATYGNTSDMDHQVSPVNVPSGELGVAMYGLIWGWTSQDDSQPGAWITGPGLNIGQIYTGKARLPVWDAHNNLIFFAQEDTGGFDLYRTTFDGYYQDVRVVNYLEAEVLNVVWLGLRSPY